jgi:hypothetical protein
MGLAQHWLDKRGVSIGVKNVNGMLKWLQSPMVRFYEEWTCGGPPRNGTCIPFLSKIALDEAVVADESAGVVYVVMIHR